MDGMVYLYIGLAIGLYFAVAGVWDYTRAQRLDRELTAYVSEGTIKAETAKAILETKATTGRKRDVAALIAEGMDADEGLTLLDAMPAS